MRRIIILGILLSLFTSANVLQAQDNPNSSAEAYEAYQAGKAKAEEKNFEEALEMFKKAIEVGDPEKSYDAGIIKASKSGMAAASINMAIELRKEEKYEEALAAYLKSMEMARDIGNDKIIQIATDHGTKVAYVQGNQLKKEESYEDAIQAYKDGIALDSNFYQNYLGLAQALEESGQMVAALEGYIETGELLLSSEEEEDKEKAEKMFSKAENMVAVTWGDNKWDATVEMANAFLDKRESPEAHYYLAYALKEKGDTENAMAHIDKALEMAGDAPADKYYMAKAEILEKQGDTEAAIATYKKVTDTKYKERAEYKINELSGGK